MGKSGLHWLMAAQSKEGVCGLFPEDFGSQGKVEASNGEPGACSHWCRMAGMILIIEGWGGRINVLPLLP